MLDGSFVYSPIFHIYHVQHSLAVRFAHLPDRREMGRCAGSAPFFFPRIRIKTPLLGTLLYHSRGVHATEDNYWPLVRSNAVCTISRISLMPRDSSLSWNACQVSSLSSISPVMNLVIYS